MLCVVTLIDLTIAHVRLNMMETVNRSVQNADCRLQTGYKMQTRYKKQAEDCRLNTKCRLSSKCRLARENSFFPSETFISYLLTVKLKLIVINISRS